MMFLRNNSLGIVLFLATFLAILGMLFSGWHVGQEESLQHGDTPPLLWDYAMSSDFLSALFENWESEFLQMAMTVAEHLVSAQFWFESLQNWQSEFLSTLVLVILSIFLRFRGSPESKPVAASYSTTG